MQRLKTRPQFQATMAGGSCSRTAHFVLHRLVLERAPIGSLDAPLTGPGASPSRQDPQALFVVPGQHQPAVWLGPLVPKRWAKRSVTRHTIKRQIYAVATDYAAQLAQLPAAAYVVRLRAGFDRRQFLSATSDVLKAAVREELQQLFAHAVRRKHPKPMPDAGAQQTAAPRAPDGVA